MKMKRILIPIVLLTLLFSCYSDNGDVLIIGACGVDNPVEQLPWLKTRVDDLKNNGSDLSKFFYVQIAEYQEETVFIFNNCCPTCNTIIPVYKCQGDLLGTLFTEIQPNEISNSKILYRPKDFSCNIN